MRKNWELHNNPLGEDSMSDYLGSPHYVAPEIISYSSGANQYFVNLLMESTSLQSYMSSYKDILVWFDTRHAIVSYLRRESVTGTIIAAALSTRD